MPALLRLRNEHVAVSWERSFELSGGAVRAHLFLRRVTRCILRLRDDGVQSSATPVPASKTRVIRVSFTQQKLRGGPQRVPFGGVFDTGLSRLWNAAAIVQWGGK
jgi:hypothetical protein